ncbi:MAG: hypothetical protein L3J25_10835 [Flavobacteriaceae bacterium]|nr:hypothetical protein [Flavobacteriaceae bacterium]
MKKLILLTAIALFAFSYQVEAQEEFECPPGAWCHPNGSGLGGGPWEYGMALIDGMTRAGDAVGKNLNKKVKDSGSDKGIWGAFVNWVNCSFGENTPQYTNCQETSTQSLTEKERRTLSTVKSGNVALKTNSRPIYFDSKNGRNTLKISLNKIKRGQVIKKWKRGNTLIFGYKYYTSKDKKNYGVMYYLKNKKGKVIANFMLLTKNNRTYLFDMGT